MTILQFEQPKAMKHSFVIAKDGIEIGSVTYTSITHRKARATLNGSAWHFTEKGLLGNKVVITDAATNEEIAHYQKPFFKKGIVHLGGKPYTFRGRWLSIKSRYFWDDIEGNQLVEYAYSGLIRIRGEIMVDEKLLDDPLLRTLVVLGMFVAFNADEDESSSVAA